MARPSRAKEYFPCPHCGADVLVGAKHCDECGSDDETGWSETAYVAALDLPEGYGGEDDFDYDEFAENELDRPRLFAKKPGILKYWPYIAGVLVLVMLLAIVQQPEIPPEAENKHDEFIEKVLRQADKMIEEHNRKKGKE
jgi:hypothetical protein